MKKKSGIIILVLFFILSACSSENNNTFKQADIEKGIVYELLSKNTNTNTEISYKIKMTNNTDYVIAQNNVMFSFPKSPTKSGQTTNPFKVLAKGNKLNVKPGDSVVLEVSFSPDFYSEFKNTEVTKANLYITGYIDKLADENHFDFIKSINLD
ncbi:hypothetical protein COL68_18960 [Bacillus wiedmannii]|uniref:hypothetical protein n=1 Tax=Bacillus TaxID=1386 RepID=UPI000BF605C6|nr:hypothetical protein [Bacillus wiedmannii]PFY99516.1 hypothetical protein COL57_07035 [Bacillus wiedmannii]PFZ55445.1 hypothetical protein COL68_18960 [Bacillus wiedmannii]PGE33584.1 hypothetical protein COM52_07720 [Bacillus wiedmannii]PHA34651.1 hypothetical protein COF06_23615 [Bacillus wiedmannii]PHG49788.1 hypothetical protein COI54_09430 [Bacillus wiedmannii]